MHVLFAEGMADWDYLRAYADCPDEMAAHVATRTPSGPRPSPGSRWTRSWTSPALRADRKSFIRCHHGFSRSRNGAVNMTR